MNNTYSEILASMDNYWVTKDSTCSWGEGEIQCIKLYKEDTQIGWWYYEEWEKHPNIEYWLNHYMDEVYKEYKDKYEQIEELMQEGKVLESKIMDVSDTLDYYRGFNKEEDLRKEALDKLSSLSQDLGL